MSKVYIIPTCFTVVNLQVTAYSSKCLPRDRYEKSLNNECRSIDISALTETSPLAEALAPVTSPALYDSHHFKPPCSSGRLSC